jgi:hypothetical protein
VRNVMAVPAMREMAKAKPSSWSQEEVHRELAQRPELERWESRAVEGCAGGSGEYVAIEGEDEDETDGCIEEELDWKGGGEGLAGVGIGRGGPGKEEAGSQGDAAGDDEFGQGEEEAVLPAGGRKEEGVEDDGI